MSLHDISAGGNVFTVAEVDLRLAHLDLYFRDPQGERFGQFEVVRDYLSKSNRKLLFATNVGIFNPDFTPCGLHIENGVEMAPLNNRDGGQFLHEAKRRLYDR